MFIASRYALAVLLACRRDAIIIIKFMIYKNKEFLYWVRNYHFSVSSRFVLREDVFNLRHLIVVTLAENIYWGFLLIRELPSVLIRSLRNFLSTFWLISHRNKSLSSHRWASLSVLKGDCQNSGWFMELNFIKRREILFLKNLPCGKIHLHDNSLKFFLAKVERTKGEELKKQF